MDGQLQLQRTPRKNRGTGGNGPLALPKPTGRTFAKTSNMRTAKSMVDTIRKETQRAEQEEHLGPPPVGANLIQARLVLPGKHLLPSRLDGPEALHDIRRKYRVYITNVKPNILDIQCDSIARLQEAIKAINWAIHEMRVSDDHPDISYLLQKPTNAFEGGTIKVELDSRPYFISKSSILIDNSSALNDYVSKISAKLLEAVPTLTTLNKNLSMRVVFGHLKVKSKRKGSGNELSKDDFVKLLKAYSSRGGGRFDPKLSDVNDAVNLLRRLTENSTGVCESVTYSCSLIFSMQGKEIATDIMTDTGHGKPILGLPRATKPEAWARLNWTFAAPDMKHDWTFRVDTLEKSADFSPVFNNLAQKIILEYRKNENDRHDVEPTLLQFPRINKLNLGTEQNDVTKIRMRRTATIPYKDTPYMLKINVTKTWEGNRVSTPPEVTWGFELFAAHWDESLNHIGIDQRKKDWGEGLEHIWYGDEDLDTRFEQFLKVVLEVQLLLEASGPWGGSLLD